MTKNEIKNLIMEIAEYKEADIACSDNLIEMGIIDSLMVMEIIDYIEDKYQMEFPPESIVPENFESIDKLYEVLNKILP